MPEHIEKLKQVIDPKELYKATLEFNEKQRKMIEERKEEYREAKKQKKKPVEEED